MIVICITKMFLEGLHGHNSIPHTDTHWTSICTLIKSFIINILFTKLSVLETAALSTDAGAAKTPLHEGI